MSADPILNSDRLQEILDLKLTDSQLDQKIQDLLSELADDMELPIALVSIVLGEAQYFLGMHGLKGWLKEVRGTPMEWSFCKHVVLNDESFVVENAAEHPDVKDNPLVTLEGIGCYAGVPLKTQNGQVLGSLCVIGQENRSFAEPELAKMRRLAGVVMERLEARREPAE